MDFDKFLHIVIVILHLLRLLLVYHLTSIYLLTSQIVCSDRNTAWHPS